MSFSLLIRPASAVSGGADNSITFGGEGVLTEIQAVLKRCRSQKQCVCFFKNTINHAPDELSGLECACCGSFKSRLK